MVLCSIRGCKNNNQTKNFKKDMRFFKFPNDIKTRKLWVKLCDGGQKCSFKYAKICSIHFTEEDYSLRHKLLNIPINKRQLNPSAIPTQYLPLPIKISAREERAKIKARKEIVTQMLENFDKEQEELRRANEEIKKALDAPKDVHTQTVVDNEGAKVIVIMELEAKKKQLENQLINLRRKCEVHDQVEKSLSKIFTSGQMSKLRYPANKIEWSVDDISSASCLYSAGPKTYRYLRKNNFPLPGPATLRKWEKKIEVEPGILSDVLNLMEKCDLDEKQRLCVLCFDKMKTISDEYDQVDNAVLSPSNDLLVLMARGILHEWKQPIFYAYDCEMTKTVINEIISKLHRVGYKVVAIVSDMSPCNRNLWRDLEINIMKTWIQHPDNLNEKIFVFADTPHLLKLLRNHFIHTGFTVNEKFINVEPIREYLNLIHTSNLKMVNKITENHLNVESTENQEVKLAAQLFSHTVSTSLKRCLELGKCNSGNALACANFIKLVNDWFDILNSETYEFGSYNRLKPFGIALDEQNEILKEMDDTILNLRIPQEQNLLPFQKGILITNLSLKGLFKYLQDIYGIKYLLTARVNQDILEIFFNTMRSKSGLNDHQTGLEFKYWLRSHLLGNLSIKI